MIKVLLDTNIILDFALERKPFYENSELILQMRKDLGKDYTQYKTNGLPKLVYTKIEHQ